MYVKSISNFQTILLPGRMSLAIASQPILRSICVADTYVDSFNSSESQTN